MIDDVIDKVLNYIQKNRLQAGHKLPPERVLAEELGLNRTSLREGLAVMEYMRYIERRQGSGAFILDLMQSSFEGSIRQLLQQDGISLEDADEIYEAVVMIESTLAKLAAEKHTPEDIKILNDLNSEIKRMIDQGQNTYTQDIEFHRRIALMSKNTFLIQISTAFWLRLAGYAQVIQANHTQARDLLQHHLLIVEAIKERDGYKTEQLMKQHYRYSMEVVKNANISTRPFLSDSNSWVRQSR